MGAADLLNACMSPSRFARYADRESGRPIWRFDLLLKEHSDYLISGDHQIDQYWLLLKWYRAPIPLKTVLECRYRTDCESIRGIPYFLQGELDFFGVPGHRVSYCRWAYLRWELWISWRGMALKGRSYWAFWWVCKFKSQLTVYSQSEAGPLSSNLVVSDEEDAYISWREW